MLISENWNMKPDLLSLFLHAQCQAVPVHWIGYTPNIRVGAPAGIKKSSFYLQAM